MIRPRLCPRPDFFLTGMDRLPGCLLPVSARHAVRSAAGAFFRGCQDKKTRNKKKREKFRYNKKIREKQRKQVYKSVCNWTVGKLLYLIELALDMFEC